MKRFFLLMILSVCKISASAQATTSEDSVKLVVNELFAAMKANDGKRLAACFSDSAILQTIVVNKKGETRVLNEQIASFVKSVEAAPAGSLDERIQFSVVKVDATLGIAWTPYSFYFNGKFSHCGVNSFQLVRFNGNWKIQYLIDTRRKNCEG